MSTHCTAPINPVGLHDKPEEKQFIINDFRYAAKLWGQEGGLPMIALHGWLDNCASFDVLAPMLDNVQCLAVDLAGHGLSQHRAGLDDYPLWSEVSAIYAIADEMGWERFALVGHSRGAMMSLITAGVFPERISHLVFIDSLAPPVIDALEAPQRFINSIAEIQRRVKRPLSLYPTYDDALAARCMSPQAPVTRETAALLSSRGLRKVGEKYHWHADGKIWAPSNVGLSQEMVDAFAQAIARAKVPSLLLLGEQGLIHIAPADSGIIQRSQKLSDTLNVEVENFNDGHFLHMEVAAEAVAARLNRFLSTHIDH